MFDLEQPDAYMYAEIVKSEPQDDGSVIVYGRPSQDVLDVDDQIADKQWLKQALPEWYQWGNIREMHQMKAVGTAQSLEFDENDDPWVKSKIVDSEAVKKVRAGVYKGYSIGIKKPVLKRDRNAPKGRFVGGKILELSLVDRPAVPTAKFDIVKAAGTNEWLDCQTGFVVEDTSKAGNVQDPTSGNSVDFDSLGNPVLQPGHLKSDDANITIVSMDARGAVVQMGTDQFLVPYSVESDGSIKFGEPQKMPAQMRAHDGPIVETDAKKAAQGGEGMADKKKPHIGLSDALKAKFKNQAEKDPTDHITAAMRRLVEWADSGAYPTGLNHADLKWMYGQYSDILHHRDKDSDAGKDFPGEKAEKSAVADDTDTDKCASLTNTLGEVKEEAEKEMKDGDKANKAAAIVDAAKAAMDETAHCPECQKRVKLGDKVKEEDGKGGKHVTYKGECGHMVHKFVKDDETKADGADANKAADTTPPSGQGAGAGDAKNNKGEPPKDASGEKEENDIIKRMQSIIDDLEKNQAGADNQQVENKALAQMKELVNAFITHQQDDKVEGKGDPDEKKTTQADLQSLIADVVKAALSEAGVLPDAEKAFTANVEKLKATHEKLGATIDELTTVNKAAGSDQASGGPVPVDKTQIYERLREGISEFDELARLLTSTESSLIHNTGEPGNLGPDNKAIAPAAKPGGDNMDFTRGDGGTPPSGAGADTIKADAIAEALKSGLADVTKTFGEQLNGMLQPLAERLSTVEHMANNTTKAQLYVAENPNVFSESQAQVQKAAVADVRQKYAEMTPKEQEQFTQQLIMQARKAR